MRSLKLLCLTCVIFVFTNTAVGDQHKNVYSEQKDESVDQFIPLPSKSPVERETVPNFLNQASSSAVINT